VKIIYCKTCLMPSSRPRIEFDDEGICNACRNAESKQTIDWEARKREFLSIVEPYRSRNGNYDCVVPWSGGKDSSSIAWRLKFEFGLNPLLVTFSPLIPNEVGAYNREQMILAGFDHLMVRPNQRVSRYLAKRFFSERGNPKVHWDAGVNSVPIQVAVNYNIPLVFYAEHGESEYGGRVLSEEHKKIRDFAEVLEHQIGDDPQNWVDGSVSSGDVLPYLYPPVEKVDAVGVKAMYFAYFFRWSMFENYEYIKSKIDFHTALGGRTDGTFTDFDSLDDKIDDVYYYLQFIKFGFGRAIRDASRMINNGHLTRSKGLELARQYDGEFPSAHYGEVLDYLSMTPAEFTEIVDLHRNDEIWETAGNQSKLRHQPE
jgi:N-acetyl sugar amidotransferase